jgi:hypothetical protein
MAFLRPAVIGALVLAGACLCISLWWINEVGNSRYRNRSYAAQPVRYCQRMSDARNSAQLSSLGLKPESYLHCMKWDLDADRGDEAVMIDLAKLTHPDKR